MFLSDKALHLFLQSNMSVKQIENYLSGQPVELDGHCPVADELIHGHTSKENEETAPSYNKATSDQTGDSLQRIIEAGSRHGSLSEPIESGARPRTGFVYESFGSLPQSVIMHDQPMLSICAGPDHVTNLSLPSDICGSQGNSSATMSDGSLGDQLHCDATKGDADDGIISRDLQASETGPSSVMSDTCAHGSISADDSDILQSETENLDVSSDSSDVMLDVPSLPRDNCLLESNPVL